MNGKIYIIRCVLTDKVYVGQTVQPISKRWSHHKWIATKGGSQTKLARAIRKYGIENFTLTIIDVCELESLNEREIEFIREFDSYNNGYNSTVGGHKVGTTGMKHSELTCAKISKANKGNSGSRHTEKWKKELSKRMSGQNNPMYGKTFTHSEKSKELIREAATKTPVEQIHLESNNIITIWPSTREAERALGISSASISQVINNKRKSAGGFLWRKHV